MKTFIHKLKTLVWEGWVIFYSSILGLFRADKLFKANPIRRIIIYHHVGFQDIENFKKQIRYFTENYRVLSLSEFLRKAGSREDDNEDMLCITFDDAFRCIYDIVSPILDGYNIKPCIFIPAGFVETSDKSGFLNRNIRSAGKIEPLSWEQLGELVQRNYEVGSHSFNHVDFGQEDVDFARELKDSREIIQNKLKIEVRYFAFPFGKAANISQSALEKVKEYGYIAAFSGINANVNKAEFILPRIYINARWSIPIIKFMLRGFFDKNESLKYEQYC